MVVKHYLKVYRQLAIYNFSSLVASRLDFMTLVAGKFLRMGFLFLFILGIFEFIPDLAGYTKGEVILFFAFFNLLDLLVQIFFFRGFWFLQDYVRSGEFDKILTYPISPIFLVAFKITDWMDVITLVPTVGLFVYALSYGGSLTLTAAVCSSLLVVSALLVAFGFCLFVASVTFYTTKMGNLWWLYRDLAAVARFPLNIFPPLLVVGLTFLVPIGVIFNWPARALLGELSWLGVTVSFTLAVFWLGVGKWFWDFSIQRYSSASS